MKSNSRVLRGWRDFGVKATAIILTILLATQMVGTPAFATATMSNKQASEDIATTVDDTGVELSGTEATDTTVPDEAAGAANEPAPADSTQATEEPVAETAESATEPATETPAADPAANTVLGAEPEPASDSGSEPAPAVEQDQLASIKLNLADGASITLSKDGNKIDDDTNPVDVPANEELKFTAQAAEGWQVDKVKTVIDGIETELTADTNGEYKVAADKVTDALTVKVEASAVEVTEQPVVSEEPAPVEGEEVTSEAAGTPEAPAVLESEEVVADVASPAFEGYAYVGNIIVKVTAGEGVLPEGTTVSAYQVNRQDVMTAVSSVVEKSGAAVNNAVAIDVTLIGPDGNVIQPEGSVNVCFFDTALGNGDINVYRVSDDATSVQQVSARQAEPSVQSFDVSHFSIYVVTEEGEPALATYNFYVGDQIVSTQIVKNGETLYEPEAPEADENGAKFIGWYTEKDNGGDEFNGFGEVTVTSTSPVNLYARFAEVHYVFFYDNQDRIFHTEEGVTGHSVSVGEATQILEQSLPINQGLAGWYTSEGFEGDSVESVTLENANIYLYPKVVDGHWITFNTEGGTYIEPQFVAGGATSIEPETPTRTGYTFVDWQTEDGKSFDFGDELTDDVKLVARWNPGQTSYRVIYWVEKANWKEGDNVADRYSFMSSEVIDNVRSGSTTDVSGINWRDWNYNDLSFNDAEPQTIEQQTVAGDGSTIVNVYYNRAVETVTFYTKHTHSYDDWRWQGGFLGHIEYTGGCYGSGWHREDDTACGFGTGWVTAYTITAKVGAYIGDQWPTSEDVDGGPYRWAISESARTWQAHMEVMPSGGDEFWGETASGTSTATYWVENVEGTGYEVHHRDVSAGTGMGVSSEDKYALQGFTYDRGPVDGSDYSGADFYYTRNDYTVSFINGDEQQDRTKPYQASLDDLAYTPNKPSTVEENFVFAGWYDNQFGEGEPFNFDTTMPAYNLSLYAVWKAPEVSVSYYSDMDGTGSPQTVEGVSYGETINENQLGEPAEVEDMQFVGWATRTGAEGNYVYTLFNFDTEIRSDVVLYPYYISEGSFKVTYNLNGASGAAPIDYRAYAEDAYADVLSAEGMTAPEGEVFLGWSTNEDGTGTLYQPEDKILIEGNVTLYAHWGHGPSQVTVTYDANYPEGAVPSGAKEEYTTDPFLSNAEHTVLEFEAIEGFEVPGGYKFAGWTNGSATYKPGDKVRVDELQKGGDNTLTAQWTHVGTQIYVKVVLDGNQVAADKYVNPVVDGTTQGFMAAYDPNTQLYTIDYTYENFNCADFKLVTFDIPAGYVVSVSSNNTNDTTGIDGSTAEYHDPVEENGNWTLDNVPGGATVTVDLHKSEYIVKYVADDNGSVSTKQEVVKYGENANGSTATPDDGYFFVNWTDSEDEVVSTDPTYVPQNITSNATYTAHFAKKYEVTVKANSGSKTYDGEELEVSGFQNWNEEHQGIEVTANEQTYYVSGLTSEARGTDVADSKASIPVAGTAVVKDAEGNVVTDQFSVKVENGSLTIEKAAVTVMANDASKVFGSADPEFTASVVGEVEGEEGTVQYTVTRPNAGTDETVGIYPGTVVATGEADQGNYSVTFKNGDFEITQQTINPDDPDNPESYLNVQVSQPDDVTYNGKHQQSPVTVERVDVDGNVIATLVERVDYELSYVDDVNAGEAKVTVTGINNYTGTVEKTYTINPAAAMIVVYNNAKVYGEDDPAFQGKVVLYNDGAADQPLYTNVLTGELDTLGDITYSRTNADVEDAGTYEGVLTAEVKDGTLNSNYTYDVWPGDFHIAKSDELVAKITTSAEDLTKVYDGNELTLTAEATPSEGTTLMYSTDGGETWSDQVPSLTNVGTLDVMVKAVNPNYEDSYPVEATLSVTVRSVTITTNDAAKVFDGTELTNETYKVTSGSFVEGETYGMDFGESGQTAVGKSANNATVVFAGEGNQYTAQANNYSVTVVPGTLLVYPQSIDPEDPDPENPDPENPDQPFYNGVKVTGPEDVDYNGLSQQLPPTVTDRNDNPLDPNYYDVAYSDDTVNTGTVTITVTGKNGYTGEVQVTYQIKKVGLTITTPDAGKVYDGTPLQNQVVQADGWKDNDASQVTLTANGSITEVGSTLNTYVATDPDNVLRNYSITEDLGTLTVWPQSIDPTDPGEDPDPDDPDAPDPSDPDPDFPGEDPDPDNPVVPDQPFYTGAEVNAPQDVSYNGADQTWAPTVTDAEGNLLTAGEDYEVSYSTDDRTNVTGVITVTITGKGNYSGTITREYQITPLEIDVYIESQTKVEGEADPTFTFNYEGVLEGESMGWTGAFVRDAGEAAGTYKVAQGGFVLADNEAGNFLASNYTLTVHPGTLTITAAPVPPGPDDPDPVTPVTPLPTPDPTPVPTPTPGDPGATETTTTPATEEATETIDDEATPLTAPEPIDDDGTPLASGAHRDCWVHWLMLLGILVTVVYYGGVGVRRVRFSSSLQSFEDDVLGNDETNR